VPLPLVTGDRGALSTRRGRSNLPSPALVASLSPHFAAKLSRETWDFVPWARFKSELAQRRCRPGAGSHDIFLEEWVTLIAGRFGFRLSDASALGAPFRPDEMRANCSWAALDEEAAQSNPAGPSEPLEQPCGLARLRSVSVFQARAGRQPIVSNHFDRSRPGACARGGARLRPAS
jgi:hypothetical protein